MRLILGDCQQQLRSIVDDSVDSLVTDPPAGISFMGKSWDSDKGGRKEWVAWMESIMRECLRVMKPGAHGLVWALPRTSHWTATALEDAGFEIRDVITHHFGSGFPKSLDVSKAIDKAAGVERPSIPLVRCDGKIQHNKEGGGWKQSSEKYVHHPVFEGSNEFAKQWQGWGTALKPASEHWILVRKPCSEKTVAANVLKWGCGAINIDGSRIEGLAATPFGRQTGDGISAKGNGNTHGKMQRTEFVPNIQGRFPANLVLSHSEFCTDDQCDIECAIAIMDAQSIAGGMHSAGKARANMRDTSGDGKGLFPMHGSGGHRLGDSGGASRFFARFHYCPKISSSERNAGLEGMPDRTKRILNGGIPSAVNSDPIGMSGGGDRTAKNHHPTVKPKKLMSYLIKLITPPNGVVLDPFMGSGSTGIAAKECGFDFIGIEREQEYFEIAERRINA